jgi:hypothetical protein
MISIICPWYQNISIVLHQLNVWNGFCGSLKHHTEFILVDDGSPTLLPLPDVDLNLTLARIKQDIPWNQPGARNLGAHLSAGEFIFFTDIDHEITQDALNKAVNKAKQPNKIYVFNRYFNGRPHYPPPCSFIINRRMFGRIGGFDEDFSGHRGHDDTMFRLLADSYLEKEIIDGILILHGDALTSCLDRDAKRNTLLLEAKKWDFMNGAYENPHRIRFEWEIVHKRKIGR